MKNDVQVEGVNTGCVCTDVVVVLLLEDEVVDVVNAVVLDDAV